MANKKYNRLTEDFLDTLDSEDIVQTDDNLKSYDPEKYPVSLMLYVSPFVITNPSETSQKSTSEDTILKMYNRIVSYCRNCPGLLDEHVCKPVYFGDKMPLGHFEQVTGDVAARYHAPGLGYYIFEVLFIPKFRNVKQLVMFVGKFYDIMNTMNNRNAKFILRIKGGRPKAVDMHLPNLYFGIKYDFKCGREYSDLSRDLAWKSINIVAEQLFDDKIKAYMQSVELFRINLATKLEEQMIGSFNYKLKNGGFGGVRSRSDKCKKVTVKAGPRNVMKSADITGNLIALDDNRCWIAVYDAYTISYVGNFLTGRHTEKIADEIISELNAQPRHFTDVRWQVYREDYVQFMGHLGLFWLESQQKLVLATWSYYTKITFSGLGCNDLQEYALGMMKRFGGTELDGYRLYNDIDHAASS